MKNVEYQTRQLIREIKRSNVYNQYRRLQMKIVRDEALNRRVSKSMFYDTKWAVRAGGYAAAGGAE